MTGFSTRLNTAYKLGLSNILKVLWYRRQSKSGGLKNKCAIKAFSQVPELPCNKVGETLALSKAASEWLLQNAEALLSGKVSLFSWHEHLFDEKPDWFAVKDSNWSSQAQKHWSEVNEFSTQGDIKWVWELSRFDWLLVLVRAYRLSGKKQYLEQANLWLSDWCLKNPVNQGPNWKCGQECALRLLNVFLALRLLGATESQKKIWAGFVVAHATRIAGTMYYAKAQKNNHYTSEAAALYIAGLWLQDLGIQKYKSIAQTWQRKGRKALESGINNLVLKDGTFAQYSTNYHRLFLDTLSVVEIFRRSSKAPKFSKDTQIKLQAAANWLFYFVDEVSGQAPNLGGNDGARLLQFDILGYRNFKPSVQLAMNLFSNQTAYEKGAWDEPLIWLEVNKRFINREINKKTRQFEEGGAVFLKAPSNPSAFAFIRYPVFRFRPSQADCFHVDLWVNGINLLRDAGTYAYHGSDEELSWYPSVAAHNSISFDDADAMPKLSRFLYVDWCKMIGRTNLQDDEDSVFWQGVYKTSAGAIHQRKVSAREFTWVVEDEIKAYQDSAKLRWRLNPQDWWVTDNGAASDMAEISVRAEGGDCQFVLTESKESLYYQVSHPIPLLEVTVSKPTTKLVTEIRIKQS